MKEEAFRDWLRVERGLDVGSVGSRLSNCRRVERYEGDLDALYDCDELAGLLRRLNPAEPGHEIRIAGNAYNVTATLKTAVGLYRDFRRGGGRPPRSGGAPAEPRRHETAKVLPSGWPRWPTPTDEDLLELAIAMAPFVRFLDPGIVDAVVRDNRRNGDKWSASLEKLEIDPFFYLWEGSPCAFPGVRRHAGRAEIEAFRKGAKAAKAQPQCLALDDNDYPKHLWSFVFTGKPFRKRGPSGYQLAHLLDHKDHGNRWRKELDHPPSHFPKPKSFSGLFTSAANAAYAPGVFLRPTDLSPRLRQLIQRRAQQLYRDVCRLAPPPLEVKPNDDPEWDVGNFRWSAPVGDMECIEDFLEFRRNRVDKLIENGTAAASIGGNR